MITATFAIPGDLATPTGGYRYDREVLARASAHGVEFDHLALPGSFPFPTPDELLRTAGLFVSHPADRVLMVDGLAYGALPESICLSAKSPIVALVHHPLALESGLAAETAARLKASEAAALVHARRIIVTSRITVAEPGTAPAPRAIGSGRSEPTILTVGAISARKGYDVLVAALARLQGEAWRLVIAGATDRAPEVHAALREAIRHHGLEARVTLTGAISDAEIEALYAQADLFVMPSRYEGYGMVLAEAMARGLPIITTTGGAAAETVPDGAAVKVPPDDALALSAALSRLIQSPRMRADLAARSFEAGRALPGWDDTARIVASVVAGLATGAPSHFHHPGSPR